MPDHNTFAYSYSAQEQAEIKKIRERYAPTSAPDSDNIERLRRLDAGVTRKGSGWALTVGIVSAIVMGTGMSLVMTDLGSLLGLPYAIPIGIAIGILGMVGMAMAYPIYNRVVKKERERIAPEIIRLTDELLK